MTWEGSDARPIWWPIQPATCGLSPVIILILTPNFWASLTAGKDVGLRGSVKAIRPVKVYLALASVLTKEVTGPEKAVEATARTRRPIVPWAAAQSKAG